MDELTRFARVLVERLGAQSGAPSGPVSVRAIRKEILPYRAERRNLGLSSVEDYETVLLRLVAEEKGFVKTAPGTAAERCREVLAHPNPDLDVLEEIADSTIQFTSLAAGPNFEQTTGRQDGQTVTLTASRQDGQTAGGTVERKTPKAEPAPSSPSHESPSRPANQPPRRQAAEAVCQHCNGTLPTGRVVVFCPWCGERLIPLLCAQCGAEFESGWRHCVTCGSPVRDPYRPS
jgi:predicted RNA-binding Zn-ribbon protein involved in translation (DUF1610 family)